MNTKECKEAIVQKLIAEYDNIFYETERVKPKGPMLFDVKYWVRESKETNKQFQEIVRYFRHKEEPCLSAVVGTDMNGNLKYIDIEMD